jgi:hypothetical protein
LRSLWDRQVCFLMQHQQLLQGSQVTLLLLVVRAVPGVSRSSPASHLCSTCLCQDAPAAAPCALVLNQTWMLSSSSSSRRRRNQAPLQQLQPQPLQLLLLPMVHLSLAVRVCCQHS